MPSSEITLETILAAAQTGEGVDWEFKCARGRVPKYLRETSRFKIAEMERGLFKTIHTQKLYTRHV